MKKRVSLGVVGCGEASGEGAMGIRATEEYCLQLYGS